MINSEKGEQPAPDAPLREEDVSADDRLDERVQEAEGLGAGDGDED